MADLGAIGITRSLAAYHATISRATTVRSSAGLLASFVVRDGTISTGYRGYAKEIVRSGTVGVGRRNFKRIPWWTSDSRPLHTIPTDSSLQGVVKKQGAGCAGLSVHLYYHANGSKIETAKTGLQGEFRFDYLDSTDHYFVVISDNTLPPFAYNAKVFDFVKPA